MYIDFRLNKSNNKITVLTEIRDIEVLFIVI